tara:strand:- start:242 stop:766 length:525 start_codon:yes stop_codon:yes gene_type:complete
MFAEMETQPRLTKTYRLLVRGTNINETSLLATDYLNHFNEVVMLLELIPDMPEMLEEVEEWKPATYTEHFAASGFSDKELAIWAYENAPHEYTHAFEDLVATANEQIFATVDLLKKLNGTIAEDAFRDQTMAKVREITLTLEQISGVINGTVPRYDQAEIDDIMDQSAIDSLFD